MGNRDESPDPVDGDAATGVDGADVSSADARWAGGAYGRAGESCGGPARGSVMGPVRLSSLSGDAGDTDGTGEQRARPHRAGSFTQRRSPARPTPDGRTAERH